MAIVPHFRPAPTAFMRAQSQSLSALSAQAALFAAPHGTPYAGIDNRVHAGTGAALRGAIADDATMIEHWDYDLDGPVIPRQDWTLADLGDLGMQPQDGAGNRHAIEQTARAILAAGAIPLILGGDDSVPIPFLAGFDGPLTILQIDAHIDWRDERFGERLGFSSTMRRASELPSVKRIVQVGMRGLGSARVEEVTAAAAWGARIVPARRILTEGVGAALEHVEAGARVVICLDLDGLDASVMPAVMYPSPGGLTYLHILDLIAGVTAKAQLAGFSMVEFVPERDPTGVCAFVAARLLWHVVGRLAR